MTQLSSVLVTFYFSAFPAVGGLTSGGLEQRDEKLMGGDEDKPPMQHFALSYTWFLKGSTSITAGLRNILISNKLEIKIRRQLMTKEPVLVFTDN